LKTLKRLGRTDRERLAAAIKKLPDGDVRQLRGISDEWRLRVGDWRVRFRISQSIRMITVVTVLARGGAYKA